MDVRENRSFPSLTVWCRILTILYGKPQFCKLLFDWTIYLKKDKTLITQRRKSDWNNCKSFIGTFHELFVLRFYSPVNLMGSCQAQSNLTTLLLGRLSPLWLTSIVHILSPGTDNCSSWISGRERMTVENTSWSISTKECCQPRRGLNPRPPDLQSDGASNWATEADPSWIKLF